MRTLLAFMWFCFTHTLFGGIGLLAAALALSLIVGVSKP